MPAIFALFIDQDLIYNYDNDVITGSSYDSSMSARFIKIEQFHFIQENDTWNVFRR